VSNGSIKILFRSRMKITRVIPILLVVSVVVLPGFLNGCDWVRWSGGRSSDVTEHVDIPAPINALLPQKIEVHPFTRIGLLSQRGDIHGIDLCVRAVDSYGDATKAFGKFRFELYQFKPASPDPKGTGSSLPGTGRSSLVKSSSSL